jgi:hypothetical protein
MIADLGLRIAQITVEFPGNQLLRFWAGDFGVGDRG